MNCEKAREILWPPERPKPADDRLVAARRHVDDCAECWAFLKGDRELRERLGSMTLPPAPPQLRERIYAALARERASSDRDERGAEIRSTRESRVRHFAAAAAIIVFLVVGGWLAVGSGPSSGGDGLAPAATAPAGGEVEGFVQYAVPEERLPSTDPLLVSGFLVRELALPFQPREFEGFDLQGAEICVKDWKRGALLLYERDGALLFHYVLQVEGAQASEPTLSEATPEEWPGRPGPSAVVWSSPGVEQALVADLPAGELLGLARSPVRGF
ncbi:MAG: hypothetical protein WD960_13900 [Gemmatimonadota bacterium]